MKPHTVLAIALPASLLLAAGVAGSMAMVARPNAAAQQQAEEPRTITLAGRADVYVQPDQATLTFGIVSVDAELAKAKQTNAEQGIAVVEALQMAGVMENNVATTRLSVDPQYKQRVGGDTSPPQIIAYEVTRSYQVRLTQLDQVDAVIEAALAAGANQLSGPSYELADPRRVRDDARDRAANAAREKAERLARTLECRIGPPRAVTEVGASWFPANRFSNTMSVAEGGPADVAANGSLPAGQQLISVEVSVTFDLTPQN